MGITFNARQTKCGPCLFVYFPLAEFGFSVSIVGLDENLVKTWLYLHAQTEINDKNDDDTMTTNPRIAPL